MTPLEDRKRKHEVALTHGVDFLTPKNFKKTKFDPESPPPGTYESDDWQLEPSKPRSERAIAEARPIGLRNTKSLPQNSPKQVPRFFLLQLLDDLLADHRIVTHVVNPAWDQSLDLIRQHPYRPDQFENGENMVVYAIAATIPGKVGHIIGHAHLLVRRDPYPGAPSAFISGHFSGMDGSIKWFTGQVGIGREHMDLVASDVDMQD